MKCACLGSSRSWSSLYEMEFGEDALWKIIVWALSCRSSTGPFILGKLSVLQRESGNLKTLSVQQLLLEVSHKDTLFLNTLWCCSTELCRLLGSSVVRVSS